MRGRCYRARVRGAAARLQHPAVSCDERATPAIRPTADECPSTLRDRASEDSSGRERTGRGASGARRLERRGLDADDARRPATGSHQFQRSKSRIMLGTSSERTIVASTRIATASPSPNCCRPTIRPADEPRERGAHDDRRRRDDPARALEPVRDRGRVVGALVPRLAHPRHEEHLVVHREAEEHREEEDRDPALDLRRTGTAPPLPRPGPT